MSRIHCTLSYGDVSVLAFINYVAEFSAQKYGATCIITRVTSVRFRIVRISCTYLIINAPTRTKRNACETPKLLLRITHLKMEILIYAEKGPIHTAEKLNSETSKCTFQDLFAHTPTQRRFCRDLGSGHSEIETTPGLLETWFVARLNTYLLSVLPAVIFCN